MVKIILFFIFLSLLNLSCYFNKAKKILINTESSFNYEKAFNYKSIFQLSIDTFSNKSVIIRIKNLNRKPAFTDSNFNLYRFDDNLEFSNGADIGYTIPIILNSVPPQKRITLKCSCSDCKISPVNLYISILWINDIDVLNPKLDLDNSHYRIRSDDFRWGRGSILISIKKMHKKGKFEINIKEF